MGTLLLHGALLFSVVHYDKVEKPPPKKNPATVDVRNNVNKLRGEEKEARDGLHCGGYHYSGLGIHINFGSGEILDVGPGTPAEIAGLQAGDILLDPDALAPDRYPPGTILDIPIDRHGQKLVLKLKIGKICNED